MVVLIPMAGLGTRFKQEGFDLPKPIIEVNGKTLIEHSIETLGFDAKYVFITRRYENADHNKILSNLLKQLKPNSVEIQLDHVTRGSVETCLKAVEYINNDEELIITNCDQRLEWDEECFLNFIKSEDLDGCVVTHESENPKHSYAKTNDLGIIDNIKEKVTISKNALIGLHYWKHGRDFVTSAFRLISEFESRGLTECYVSETYNYLIKEGKKIKIYDIHPNEYICLGTPYDVSIYKSKTKEFFTEKPKTIFCDIDGTILVHSHKYSDVVKNDPVVLKGVIDKFNEWDSYGHKIILCTARKESSREITEKQLKSLGLCWDLLIMGITSGVRVLINDKLNKFDNDRAISVNLTTNDGFEKFNWNKHKL
jgi:NDP-sugar pyrophosphorylase family protein